MAYGDLPIGTPHKPNKGLEGGACNRETCQAEPALYFNHGSQKWYCKDCSIDIGQDYVNLRDWEFNFRPRLGHAQFETREEINERINLVTKTCENSFNLRKTKSPSLEKLLKQAKRR